MTIIEKFAEKLFLYFPQNKLHNLVFILGLIQMLAYYAVCVYSSPTAHVPVPQPDTLLYCQAARQIVAGEPFVFTHGDLPSSGTTSHLYPFILAIPYWLGATGESLFTAGFFLNALFYLGSLLCWTSCVKKLCRSYGEQLAVVVILGLSGHAAFGAFLQSDVGLFMFLSSALFASLLYDKWKTFACLLAISPWVRPEGMMFCVAFGFILFCRVLFASGKQTKMEWLAFALGLVSSLGVFAFNYWLTGIFQFMSVANKNYFKLYPFFEASRQILNDFMELIKSFILGMPNMTFRNFTMIPVLSAVFLFAYACSKKRDDRVAWKEYVFVTVIFLCFLSTVVGVSSDVAFNRYFIWCMPLFLIYSTCGAIEIGIKIKLHVLAYSIVLCFMICSAVYHLSGFGEALMTTGLKMNFVKNSVGNIIPENAKVGIGGSSGYIYFLPSTVEAFCYRGLYSQAFFEYQLKPFEDLLKNNANLRFDFALNVNDEVVTLNMLAKEPLAVGLDGESIAQMDWIMLDDSLKTVWKAPDDFALVTNCDVGYLEDERLVGYKTFSRYHRMEFPAFAATGTLNKFKIMDVGYPVIGWDEMNVKLPLGCDVKILMRTKSKAKFASRGNSAVTRTFSNPLQLRIKINEHDLGIKSYPISESEEEFSEIVLDIPGKFITQPVSKIEIFGDRTVFGYWLYSGKPPRGM